MSSDSLAYIKVAPAESPARTEKSDPLTATLLQPAKSAWSAVLALLLLCGTLFLHGINVAELYRTESLRAIIGAEMLRSGNWVVPVLYGQPLLTKPPGMYAAIAAVSWPFGEVTDWSARLPSAFAATGVVLLLYWYVGRQLGRFAGLVAAAVAPCTFLWLDKGSAAEIDMLQVAWVAAAIMFFLRATEDRDGQVERAGESALPSAAPTATSRSFLFWLLALLCVAGGVLTKWTAPVFFYAAAVPFLVWRRQLRLLFAWPHLVSALIGASVCLGWVGLVIHQVGWEVFHETVRAEALPRISVAHHVSNHQPAMGQLAESLLHPFKLLAVNLPWAGFALLTFMPGFLGLWDERGRRLLQAFHCWTWPNILIWSVLPEHATRHSFPLFPGVTGLAAMAWIAFVNGRLPLLASQIMRKLSLLSLAVFGLVAVGGALGGLVLLPASVWWLVVFVVLAACWCVREGFRAARGQRWGGLLTSIIITWIILKLAFVHLNNPIRDGVIPLRVPEAVASLVKIEEKPPRSPRARALLLDRAVPGGHTLYVTNAYKDEGIAFYYGRPMLRVGGWKGLNVGRGTTFALVTPAECEAIEKHAGWQVTMKVALRDQQGDPMVLMGLTHTEPPVLNAEFKVEGGRKNRRMSRRAGDRIRTGDVQLGKLAFYR